MITLPSTRNNICIRLNMGPWMVSALLVSLAAQLQASNILFLAPLGTWSEYQLATTLADTLAEVGHQVTLVAGFEPYKDSPVTEIYVGSSGFDQDQNVFEISMQEVIDYTTVAQKKIGHLMYTNKDILNIWKNRNDFDAIIAFTFFNDIITPFLMDYHGAYIGLCAVGIEWRQIYQQGNRLPRSVTPFVLVNFDDNMNFFERVVNLCADFFLTTMYDFDKLPQVENLLENYFPGMPSMTDLYSNYSLLLINSHFVIDGMYPLLPNQVEIGTLVARPPQPLPKDLREFVDGAENGVIYFSLGTLAKSTDIPKPQMAMILEAFGRLPQRVVWKLEENIKNLPSNVFTLKWLPQQDILGHPKTVVFISHCGTFGIQEAKYNGVPILGVPIAFDQHRNAARIVKKGYARVLNWEEMTVESIIENINILIKDTSYRERIKAVSKAVQDQKESPKDRAAWWIEYAIRHKDALHMQFAGKKLNAFQYHLIDVWTFLISLLMLWIYLSYWCLRRCYRKLVGSKSKQE